MTDTGVVLICFSRRSEASRTKAHFPPFTPHAAGVQSIYPNPLLNQQLRGYSGPQPDAPSRFLIRLCFAVVCDGRWKRWVVGKKRIKSFEKTADLIREVVILQLYFHNVAKSFCYSVSSDMLPTYVALCYLSIAHPTTLHSCRPAALPPLAGNRLWVQAGAAGALALTGAEEGSTAVLSLWLCSPPTPPKPHLSLPRPPAHFFPLMNNGGEKYIYLSTASGPLAEAVQSGLGRRSPSQHRARAF